MPYVKNSVNSRKRSKRSRGRKRRLLAIVTLVVIACAIFAIVRGVLTRQPAQLAASVTPAPQRTAEPQPWNDGERRRLRAMLADALGPVIGSSDRASLVVIAADGGTLYSFGEGNAVTPASVQKLVIAYAALNLLGPHFRYTTILAGAHPVGSDGVLDGNLWLVGSGDPSLRSDDLRGGVRALRTAGLHSVSGGPAVDPSFIHGPEINPNWNASDAGEDFQTAVSGVSLDGDTVEFRVYGTQPGEPARVVMLPHNTDVRTRGTIASSSGSDSVIIAPEDANGFRFSGTIPAGVEEKFWLPIHDIPHFTANVLQIMLADEGIAAAQPPAVEAAPLDSVALWEHRSSPLPALVKHMLFLSDNHYAEQLLRTLGGDVGDDSNDSSGIHAETTFLRSRAIPVTGLHLLDGSGLAEGNRISAMTLARILSDAELRDGGAELYPLLPSGGRDGTLKYYRFREARVHAKTGHLSDADSLAGYVDTKKHGRLAFAFMIDDSPGDPDSAYVRALDRLSEF